jgi:hypothetical protein
LLIRDGLLNWLADRHRYLRGFRLGEEGAV